MAKRHHSSKPKMSAAHMRELHELRALRDRLHEREGMERYEHHRHMDQMHEREGMDRYENSRHDLNIDRSRARDAMHHNPRENGRSMYEPSERAMEHRSGMMLSEDHRAIANMPQTVKYHEWPRERSYMRSNLDDTISGIDMEQEEASNIINRHKAKSMY